MNKFVVRQKGLSVTNWIIIIAVALFFTLLGLKLIPSYLEFYSIKGVLESIQNEPKWKTAPPKEIRKVFNKRIDINGVYDFDQKDLAISRGKGITTVEVDYEIRKEMVGNISVILAFYKKVEM